MSLCACPVAEQVSLLLAFPPHHSPSTHGTLILSRHLHKQEQRGPSHSSLFLSLGILPGTIRRTAETGGSFHQPTPCLCSSRTAYIQILSTPFSSSRDNAASSPTDQNCFKTPHRKLRNKPPLGGLLAPAHPGPSPLTPSSLTSSYLEFILSFQLFPQFLLDSIIAFLCSTTQDEVKTMLLLGSPQT